MKIQQSIGKEQEQTKPLKDAACGAVIRFEHDSYVDALRADLFWMRIDAPELKAGRVRLVNLADGKQIERDDCHRVIVHNAHVEVEPSEK